ncbi:MAG: hypothetical protein U0637_00610 [Phycisphaerales bacterium]
MNGEELFAVWAPPVSVWSQWAKPALFVTGGAPLGGSGVLLSPEALSPEGAHVPRAGGTTALVIDLPSDAGVGVGLSMASRGFRPVPLYNTTCGHQAVLDAGAIYDTLRRGVEWLVQCGLADGAPPAFLIDSQRASKGRSPSPGEYDNRWVVFPQDFPSAVFLRSQGIGRVLVISDGAPGEDLCEVLTRWRRGGIELWQQHPSFSGPAQPLSPPAGWRFHWWWSLMLVFMGLRANAAGGFGARVPEQSSASGGWA